MSSPDPYTPPSYRGAMFMLVLILVGVVLVWLAYSATMDVSFERGADDPGATPAATVESSTP